MSFNQASYDAGSYHTDINESMGQGRYQLMGQYGQHVDKCSQPRGTGQSHDQHYIGDVVDYQNELLGLTRRYSKDPLQQYPFKQAPVEHTYAMECASGMGQEQEHSRLDFYREQNRLDLGLERNDNRGLCLDKQDPVRIPSNTRHGLNTRLFFRDNFRRSGKLPKSQNNFDPNGENSRLQPGPYRNEVRAIGDNCKCT